MRQHRAGGQELQQVTTAGDLMEPRQHLVFSHPGMEVGRRHSAHWRPRDNAIENHFGSWEVRKIGFASRKWTNATREHASDAAHLVGA
jgi:hypothetical protein